MAFPDSFLDDLRARLPVSSVVGQSFKLRREGREFRAVDDNSLTCNDGKGLWWDHGANEGGDIFKWFEVKEGATFPEAVARCAEIAGISLPAVNGHRGVHEVRSDAQALRRPRPEMEAGDARDQGRLSAGDARRETVATFDYTDPQGSLIYQVVRQQFRLPDGSWQLGKKGKPKKTFLQRRPDPDRPGEWIWNLEGVQHGLYRLLELRESGADETVYMPEGEAKADALIAWGLVATTNSGGAANWRADHAETFRGRDVVVLLDNDEPGHARGETIAKSLFGIARSVKLLDLASHWVGAAEGADVLDWIREREGTAEELAEIVARTAAWRPPPFVSAFGGQPWENIGAATNEAYAWIVEDVIPAGEAVLIFGESGSGKSFCSFDMAMCIAQGLPFNGYNVEPGLVVYAAAEAGKGFAKRKRAYVLHHKVDANARLPFYLLTRKFDLFHNDDDTNALLAEIEAIRAMYDVPLRLVVLDTLSATTPGMNENASQDVGPVKDRIDRIRVKTGAAVALVHHKPKSGSTPRGHGSLTADFETTIEFTTGETKDDDGRPVHIATVQKQREGKSGLSWRFSLPVVRVGTNKWGNPETSCVVQPIGGKPTGKGFRATDYELVLMKVLLQAIADHGEPPGKVGLGSLPASITKVVRSELVRDAFKGKFIRKDDDDAKHQATVRGAWSRATRALMKGAVIGYEAPMLWPTGKPVIGLDLGQPQTSLPMDMGPGPDPLAEEPVERL